LSFLRTTSNGIEEWTSNSIFDERDIFDDENSEVNDKNYASDVSESHADISSDVQANKLSFRDLDLEAAPPNTTVYSNQNSVSMSESIETSKRLCIVEQDPRREKMIKQLSPRQNELVQTLEDNVDDISQFYEYIAKTHLHLPPQLQRTLKMKITQAVLEIEREASLIKMISVPSVLR